MELRNLFLRLTGNENDSPTHGLRLKKLGFITPVDAPYEANLYFPSIIYNEGLFPVTVVQFQLDFGTVLNRHLVRQGNRRNGFFRCTHSVPGQRYALSADDCAPLTITPKGTPVPVHLSYAVCFRRRNGVGLRDSLIARVQRGRFRLVACLQGGVSLHFSGKGVEIA